MVLLCEDPSFFQLLSGRVDYVYVVGLPKPGGLTSGSLGDGDPLKQNKSRIISKVNKHKELLNRIYSFLIP